MMEQDFEKTLRMVKDTNDYNLGENHDRNIRILSGEKKQEAQDD